MIMIQYSKTCIIFKHLSLKCFLCLGAAAEMIFKEGEVRLDGSSNRTGMVEIYHAGSWGRICSKNWSDKEADIVCRYNVIPE